MCFIKRNRGLQVTTYDLSKSRVAKIMNQKGVTYIYDTSPVGLQLFRVYDTTKPFSSVVLQLALSVRFVLCFVLRPCLFPRKFCKIFHIFRHIESLDAYIEY